MVEPTSQRDQRFEALFSRWNLNFEFIPELSLTDDLKVLDEAQVRDLANIGPSEQVDQYALQMKQGANFPPIVVAAQLRDSTDVMIDGNTRARAARRNHNDAFPAYRVSPIPDADFAKLLAAALNQLGGKRLERAEANKAALAAMDMGLSDDQIALEIGYSAESIRRWRRDQQFNERIDKLQLIDHADKLTKTQKREVGKVAHDEPFGELVQLVATTKPEQPDLRELLETVEKAGSDHDALVAIEKAREEWRPIGPPPQKVHRNRAAQQARMHLGGLLTVEPAAVYDPTKADDDFEKWQKVREIVDQVLAVFEQHRQPA